MTPAPKTNPKQPKAAPRRPLAFLAAAGLLGTLAYLGGPGSNAHVRPAAGAPAGRAETVVAEPGPRATPQDRLADRRHEIMQPPQTAPTARTSAVAATTGDGRRLATDPTGPASSPSPVEAERFAKELLATGRDRLADGDLAGGLEAFESAVEFYPSAETHGALGWLYFKMHVRSRANVHLQRAAMLDPDNADRWIDLANAEIQRTDIGEAWKAIERARGAEPGITIERDEDGYFQRGDEQESDVAAGTVGGAQGRNIE